MTVHVPCVECNRPAVVNRYGLCEWCAWTLMAEAEEA